MTQSKVLHKMWEIHIFTRPLILLYNSICKDSLIQNWFKLFQLTSFCSQTWLLLLVCQGKFFPCNLDKKFPWQTRRSSHVWLQKLVNWNNLNQFCIRESLQIEKYIFGMHSSYHWLIWLLCFSSQSENQRNFLLLTGSYDRYVCHGECCTLVRLHPCNVKAVHGPSSTQMEPVFSSQSFAYWPLYKVLEASISLYRWVLLKPDFLGAWKSVWLISKPVYQY